jgi:hypothetical protein
MERLDAQATFHLPATREQVQAVESALGIALPADLRNLLLETNGAEVAYGTGLVWAAEEITQRNLTIRREWQRGEWATVLPIDHLLFFGELGNGDLVCFRITAAGVRNRVFRWYREYDSWISTSTSLADWLRGQGHTF